MLAPVEGTDVPNGWLQEKVRVSPSGSVALALKVTVSPITACAALGETRKSTGAWLAATATTPTWVVPTSPQSSPSWARQPIS